MSLDSSDHSSAPSVQETTIPPGSIGWSPSRVAGERFFGRRYYSEEERRLIREWLEDQRVKVHKAIDVLGVFSVDDPYKMAVNNIGYWQRADGVIRWLIFQTGKETAPNARFIPPLAK